MPQHATRDAAQAGLVEERQTAAGADRGGDDRRRYYRITLLGIAGLGVAVKSIPLGTAYAVWVGIGAALTVGWAMATGVEPASPLKLLFIAGIVGCAAGLKLLPVPKSEVSPALPPS